MLQDENKLRQEFINTVAYFGAARKQVY